MATKQSNNQKSQSFSIINAAIKDLTQIGDHETARNMSAFVATLGKETLSVTEAANLAQVSTATIKNWIARGIVESLQIGKGKRHRVSRQSLLHTIERRADIDKAKQAFVSSQSMVEYVSGLDKATLDRLGGV